MNENELNTMSDFELMEIEDSLLLQREMDMQLRFRHTGGRFVLLALSAAIWMILRIGLVRISGSVKPQTRGLFSLVSFFVSLIVSGYLSVTIWKNANSSVRFVIRYAVHYWPATLFLIFGLVSLIRG